MWDLETKSSYIHNSPKLPSAQNGLPWYSFSLSIIPFPCNPSELSVCLLGFSKTDLLCSHRPCDPRDHILICTVLWCVVYLLVYSSHKFANFWEVRTYLKLPYIPGTLTHGEYSVNKEERKEVRELKQEGKLRNRTKISSVEFRKFSHLNQLVLWTSTILSSIYLQ
jgi:hypothetical protein